MMSVREYALDGTLKRKKQLSNSGVIAHAMTNISRVIGQTFPKSKGAKVGNLQVLPGYEHLAGACDGMTWVRWSMFKLPWIPSIPIIDWMTSAGQGRPHYSGHSGDVWGARTATIEAFFTLEGRNQLVPVAFRYPLTDVIVGRGSVSTRPGKSLLRART